jgi:DNA polymerase III epsilon subunit-like protein
VITPLPAALEGQRLAVVDVEGNGRQPPEIVEIAVLPVDDADVRGVDVRTWLVRPEKPISALVTRKVHGINNEDVANCPLWTAVAGEVQDLLTDRALVAHGAHVEHRVLTEHLPTWQPSLVIDTVRLAKHVWPGLHGGYSLDHLIEHAELDTSGINDQRRHRAGYDAWCAWRLLVALLEQSTLDWAGLITTAALPRFVPPDEPEGGLW